MKLDLGFSPGSAALAMRGAAPGHDTGPYLPTLSSAALAAWGARRMVEGYGGSLYRLRRGSDNATLDVAAAAGSDLPDYAAIAAWAGGSALSVNQVYDQAGNGKHLTQGTAGSQPSFDLIRALAGCVPFTLWGDRAGSRNHFMSSGTGLAFNRRSLSVWQVIQPMFCDNTMLFWQAANGSTASSVMNAFLQETTSANRAGINFYDGANSLIGGIGTAPRAMPSVIGVDCSASVVTTVRETTSSLSNGASQAGNLFILGSDGAFGPSYTAQYHHWATCLYPTLSTDDQLALRNALIAIYSVPTSFSSRIVFTGDSISEGYGSSLLRNMPDQLSGLPGTPEIFNLGVYGRQMQFEASAYADHAGGLFTSAYGAGKCILVIESGTNDIAQDSDDAATLQGRASGYATAAKASGYKVGLATLLPTTLVSGGNETARTAYNGWVSAGSSGADFTIDAASATNMTNPADTTYYLDGTHPTSVGYLRLASSRYGPALAAALV